MVIYQIQSYYWDDGARAISEWFFDYKALADARAKELAVITKQANDLELNSRDELGELRWPYGLPCEHGLRRREVHTVGAASIEPSVTTRWEEVRI